MINTYKRCTRCVMDTSDSDIYFDDLGQCNHCTEFLTSRNKDFTPTSSKKAQLENILTNIKKSGTGKPYDCLVGISGGIDSCYTAYICKKLGLKPLLLHLDNGWNSEIASINIETIAKKLNLDYVSYVLDWTEFKAIQLAFFKSSIVDLDIPTDLAIPASLYETASKNGIKYLISGGNYSSEGILPRKWGYHVMKDMKLYNHIVSKYGTVKRIKTPAKSIYSEIYYRFIKGIKTIYILNYIDYNKDEAKSFLEKELNWKYYGGKHYESRFTAFWQSYILPTKFNIDYRKATFSTQILTGQLNRDEAIEQLKSPSYNMANFEDDCSYFCKKLTITRSEFDAIMAQTPKTYQDFPNDEKFIDWMFNSYRKLFPNKRI